MKVPPETTVFPARRMPLKLSNAGGGERSPPRPVTWKVDAANPNPAAWASAKVAPAPVSQARTVIVAVPPATTPGTESTPAVKTPSTAKVFLAVLSTLSPERTSNRPVAAESFAPSAASSGESVPEFFALIVPWATAERTDARRLNASKNRFMMQQMVVAFGDFTSARTQDLCRHPSPFKSGRSDGESPRSYRGCGIRNPTSRLQAITKPRQDRHMSVSAPAAGPTSAAEGASFHRDDRRWTAEGR